MDQDSLFMISGFIGIAAGSAAFLFLGHDAYNAALRSDRDKWNVQKLGCLFILSLPVTFGLSQLSFAFLPLFGISVALASYYGGLNSRLLGRRSDAGSNDEQSRKD